MHKYLEQVEIIPSTYILPIIILKSSALIKQKQILRVFFVTGTVYAHFFTHLESWLVTRHHNSRIHLNLPRLSIQRTDVIGTLGQMTYMIKDVWFQTVLGGTTIEGQV